MKRLSTLTMIVMLLVAAMMVSAQVPGLQPITPENVSGLQQLAAMDAHGDEVNAVMFNPAGTMLASAGDDKTVRLWDVSGASAIGTEIASLRHEDDVSFIVFSPDGRLIITSGDFRGVQVWDTTTFTDIGTLAGSGGSVAAIAVNNAGTLLAVGDREGMLHVYRFEDLQAGNDVPLFEIQAHATKIETVAFNANDTLLATAGDDDFVRVWGVGEAAIVADAPTLTPAPSINPDATPLPEGFPAPTIAEIAVAEQVFENGRMLWVEPTGQIWVMLLEDEGQGTWAVYNDTFVEGESEFDGALEVPEGFQQPARGFGKLWRENPEIREALGWAITPEFGYVSQYEYYPGGTMDNGTYLPGPGHHVLYSLYGEAFRFDEATGMWELQGR